MDDARNPPTIVQAPAELRPESPDNFTLKLRELNSKLSEDGEFTFQRAGILRQFVEDNDGVYDILFEYRYCYKVSKIYNDRFKKTLNPGDLMALSIFCFSEDNDESDGTEIGTIDEDSFLFWYARLGQRDKHYKTKSSFVLRGIRGDPTDLFPRYEQAFQNVPPSLRGVYFENKADFELQELMEMFSSVNFSPPPLQLRGGSDGSSKNKSFKDQSFEKNPFDDTALDPALLDPALLDPDLESIPAIVYGSSGMQPATAPVPTPQPAFVYGPPGIITAPAPASPLKPATPVFAYGPSGIQPSIPGFAPPLPSEQVPVAPHTRRGYASLPSPHTGVVDGPVGPCSSFPSLFAFAPPSTTINHDTPWNLLTQRLMIPAGSEALIAVRAFATGVFIADPARYQASLKGKWQKLQFKVWMEELVWPDWAIQEIRSCIEQTNEEVGWAFWCLLLRVRWDARRPADKGRRPPPKRKQTVPEGLEKFSEAKKVKIPTK